MTIELHTYHIMLYIQNTTSLIVNR